VATVRRALGTRTLFNLLGPLLNPARPPVRLVGVYAAELVLPTAEALSRLGCESALVVHGSGLDEIALHAPTTAARVLGDDVLEMTLSPEDAGVDRAPLAALRGGGPEENAGWLRGLLAGRGETASIAAVAINAGALLWIAGMARDLREGTAEARAILLDGRAAARLESFVEVTRRA
jgi:anthranilate phosphoribosyltransferase